MNSTYASIDPRTDLNLETRKNATHMPAMTEKTITTAEIPKE
jgi:hypothetical protein